jgi:multiple sugar transport system substrate-binding protein
VSYARDGFRRKRIEFADLPGVTGSALGGTGIAVSARSVHGDAAVAVALDLASARTQQEIYAGAGGQPAHRSAWTSKAVNRDAHGFYLDTIATLDAAYVRPRFDGYIAFQADAGRIVADCLRGRTGIDAAVAELNRRFALAQGLS